MASEKKGSAGTLHAEKGRRGGRRCIVARAIPKRWLSIEEFLRRFNESADRMFKSNGQSAAHFLALLAVFHDCVEMSVEDRAGILHEQYGLFLSAAYHEELGADRIVRRHLGPIPGRHEPSVRVVTT